MADLFNLSRFVEAQQDSYSAALAEIRNGRKRTHWMWFIFPQIAGLGSSAMAQQYAIRSLEEARAYLAHPVLGQRLRECVTALQSLKSGVAEGIFGSVDAIKLQSSLTLFERAGEEPLFSAALERWFGGERDQTTFRIIDDLSIH